MENTNMLQILLPPTLHNYSYHIHINAEKRKIYLTIKHFYFIRIYIFQIDTYNFFAKICTLIKKQIFWEKSRYF